MTLRERALQANEQRDDLWARKRALRLQEEIQKVLGITIETPTDYQIQIPELPGTWFWFGQESMDRGESLYACNEPRDSLKKQSYWQIKSLADLGEAITVWETPYEPEEDAT